MAYADDLLAVQTAYANVKQQLQDALDANVALQAKLDAAQNLDTSGLVQLATQMNNDAASAADTLLATPATPVGP